MIKSEKRRRIDKIFNIIIQYEKAKNEKETVTEQAYLNYLDRLCCWFLGYGNQEIYCGLKGLYNLGLNASHATVRHMVFYMINILNME